VWTVGNFLLTASPTSLPHPLPNPPPPPATFHPPSPNLPPLQILFPTGRPSKKSIKQIPFAKLIIFCLFIACEKVSFLFDNVIKSDFCFYSIHAFCTVEHEGELIFGFSISDNLIWIDKSTYSK
jgi:hypothetical protein